MVNKMKWLSMSGIVVVILALLVIAGCASQAELDKQKLEAYQAGKQSVDITSDNVAVAAAAAKTALAESEAAKSKPAETAAALEPKKEVTLPPAVVTKISFDKISKDNLGLGDSVVLSKLLYRDTVDFEDKDYTVKTYLVTTDGLKTAYSLVDDKDFEAEPRLVHSKDSIKLLVELKDGFDMSKITEETSLKLKLFGKNVEIIKAANNELTLLHGDEAFVREGQSFNGVKLEEVSIAKAVVSCEKDGLTQTEVVRDGQIVKLCGNQVRVTEMFPRSNVGESSAFVRVGGDIVKTIVDGDAYTKDEEGDAVWSWKVDTMQGIVGFELSKKATSAKNQPLKLGDKLDLLDLGTLQFLADNDPKVEKYELSFDEDLIGSDYKKVTVFEGKFKYDGDEDAKKILYDGALFYAKDSDNKWVAVSDVKFGDSDIVLGTDLKFGDNQLALDVENKKITSLSVDSVDVSDEDHDLLNKYGSVFYDVKDSLKDDRLSFTMPEEAVKYKLEIASL